jgi:hypothetical protein
LAEGEVTACILEMVCLLLLELAPTPSIPALFCEE